MNKTSLGKKLKISILATALIGAVALSSAMTAEAARIHDNGTTIVSAEQTLSRGQTKNIGRKKNLTLRERIDQILHPKEEYAPAFKVPKTSSPNDESIIGTPLASQQQCVKYLLRNNPRPNIAVSPEELVAYYYEEGAREGIRPDVAFAQAMKETGFFSYGGTVTPDQNNFCGLGTTSAYVKGAYFASPAMGVRAHIQHLLAYASTRRPSAPIVDPRYNLVRENYGSGTLKRYSDLNGRWAVPGNGYGQSVMSMFKAILRQ